MTFISSVPTRGVGTESRLCRGGNWGGENLGEKPPNLAVHQHHLKGLFEKQIVAQVTVMCESGLENTVSSNLAKITLLVGGNST